MWVIGCRLGTVQYSIWLAIFQPPPSPLQRIATQGIDSQYIKYCEEESGYVLDPRLRLGRKQRALVMEMLEMGWLFTVVVRYIQNVDGENTRRCAGDRSWSWSRPEYLALFSHCENRIVFSFLVFYCVVSYEGMRAVELYSVAYSGDLVLLCIWVTTFCQWKTRDMVRITYYLYPVVTRSRGEACWHPPHLTSARRDFGCR